MSLYLLELKSLEIVECDNKEIKALVKKIEKQDVIVQVTEILKRRST